MTKSIIDPPLPKARGGASLAWDLLYGSLVFLGFPYLLYRRFFLKKDRGGRAEKWGFLKQRVSDMPRIWIHAVSVGEALATWTLVKQLKELLPEVEVVFSTTTDTGQDVAKKRYGDEAVFYYPHDFSRALKRTFDAVQPTIVVLMELEIWPNFTREATARGIPLLVVNGRITERSAKRYTKASWLLGGAFKRVHCWYMQNEEYAQRIRGLGVVPERVEVAGNIKYDAIGTASVTTQERYEARRALGCQREELVIVAGSTHPGEESALLAAYKALLQQPRFARLRLVLVPRHPHRFDEVAREIEKQGFQCRRRSALRNADADSVPASMGTVMVVLGDTMGELKVFYQGADLAFVGGSLIPHGGQNVTEPSGMGIPVVYGPYMHNFGEQVLILRDADAAVMVANAGELVEALGSLLSDPDKAKAMGARGREALMKRQGASAYCAKAIAKLMQNLRA